MSSLSEAMAAMVPPGARTQPVLPDDLLMVLPLFVAESVGEWLCVSSVCVCVWQVCVYVCVVCLFPFRRSH